MSGRGGMPATWEIQSECAGHQARLLRDFRIAGKTGPEAFGLQDADNQVLTNPSAGGSSSLEKALWRRGRHAWRAYAVGEPSRSDNKLSEFVGS